MTIKNIFSLLIINFIVLIADDIGCLDPNNPYYNKNTEVGYFTGNVKGGSTCNQDGWNGNYVGINLNYYYK